MSSDRSLLVAVPLSVSLLVASACGGSAPPDAASADHAHHADPAGAPPQKAHDAHTPDAAPAAAAPLVGTTAGAEATHVMEGRVRAMPPGSPASGAFFILHNPSEHPAVVVGGRTDAAASVELHTHIEEDGQFKMRQIDRIEVPAGAQVTLEPGGLHVMLIGLSQPLAEGDTVRLTLDFEGGHSQEFALPVQAIAAGSGGHKGHGGGHKGHGGGHGGGDGGGHGAHGSSKGTDGADPHAGHH